MLMDVETEMVYQMPMEDTNLKRHFKEFFGSLCKENSGRFISGILSPAINARIGISETIEEDIAFFHKENIPFCWYIDEQSDPQFKEKLLAAGLQDLGVYQGMIKQLDRPFTMESRTRCEIELVQDESLMKEFASLICPIFGITGNASVQYEEALWKNPKIYNWVLKKDGKVISALSTFVDGPVVSIWNVATDPEFRKQGYSNALWKEAVNQAFLKGCRTSMTYLTSAGMAFGICKELGYETKWYFHAYLCTTKKGVPSS